MKLIRYEERTPLYINGSKFAGGGSVIMDLFEEQINEFIVIVKINNMQPFS